MKITYEVGDWVLVVGGDAIPTHVTHVDDDGTLTLSDGTLTQAGGIVPAYQICVLGACDAAKLDAIMLVRPITRAGAKPSAPPALNGLTNRFVDVMDGDFECRAIFPAAFTDVAAAVAQVQDTVAQHVREIDEDDEDEDDDTDDQDFGDDDDYDETVGRTGDD